MISHHSPTHLSSSAGLNIEEEKDRAYFEMDGSDNTLSLVDC